MYGVLGPNGARKTTALRMLATLLEPTAGSARVFGHDIVAEAGAVRSLVSMFAIGAALVAVFGPLTMRRYRRMS